MDFTPPSHLSKSASRLARMVMDSDLGSEPDQTPDFTVEFSPSVKRRTPSSMPSKLSCSRPKASLPLQELLILSPSPVRRSRTRISDRVETGDDQVYESVGSRRRCRAKTSSIGLLGCASPRNSRRSRRRLEVDVREEREIGSAIATADDVAKLRRKRHSGKSSRKEKLSSVPSSSIVSKENEKDESNLDGIGELITDLITWKDVAKSSFWFGLGCLCFLSSCFTTKLSFSIFWAGSQLGLLFLGVSFLSNTLLQRSKVKKMQEFKLTEDDILRIGRTVLPAINLVISKVRGLFSGEASTTLKVAIFLLCCSEYGHLLTLWRLCTIGFFASFSVPKLHSKYATQIEVKVEHYKSRVLEAWQSCSHKKVIAASMATAFWNLSSLRTRIFIAFLGLVMLQYIRQNSGANLEEEDAIVEEQEKMQQALIVAETIHYNSARKWPNQEEEGNNHLRVFSYEIEASNRRQKSNCEKGSWIASTAGD
ncbi:hypothetical protein V2J09_019207 [Rumex salicifolius]